MIPKLTPKNNRRLLTLKYDRIKRELVNNYNYFSFIQDKLFFDFDSFYNNNDEIDLGDNYIIKHLYILSLPVKFKIKINSSIDVKETLVDIALIFDDRFNENHLTKNIPPYCNFSISYYLVIIGKVSQTVNLLSRMVNSFNDKTNNKLRVLTQYNLGLLQYAIEDFKNGIHNLEICYKLIIDNNLSTKNLLIVLDSLALAYLNQRMLFKSYVLIQTSINERKK